MNEFDRAVRILTSFSHSAVGWAYFVCRHANLSTKEVFDWSDDDLMRAVVAVRWQKIVDQAHAIAGAEPGERMKLRVRAMRAGTDGKRAAKLSRVFS